MKLVTREEMKMLDWNAQNDYNIPAAVLMENAGIAVTLAMEDKIEKLHEKSVSVIIGKGNNGGDGMVVARTLFNMGVDTRCFLLSDPSAFKKDAKMNYGILKKIGIEINVVDAPNKLDTLRDSLLETDVVVDAILGIGLEGNVRTPYSNVIEMINSLKHLIIVSVDVPSGIDSNTGKVLGSGVKADYTITFGLPKLGFAFYPARDYLGNLSISNINMPYSLLNTSTLKRDLITTSMVKSLLIDRPQDSNKGTFGKLYILGGATGYSGAVCLTAKAALRAGVGLAYTAVPQSISSIIEANVLEAVKRPLPTSTEGTIGIKAKNTVLEDISKVNAIAIGPGMGRNFETAEIIKEILKNTNKNILIDADGLNLLSTDVSILKGFKGNLILTPHPLEFSRLTGKTVEEILNSRVESAEQFAKEYKVVLVLKGNPTVIAGPDGGTRINLTGNSGLATGGSGDVLTGIISSLMAQGLTPLDAATAGTFIMGKCAERYAETKAEDALLPSDVIELIPEVIRDIRERNS